MATNLTIQDLKDRILQTEDADAILEMLDISAEELLDRFEDKIEERYNGLREEFSDDETEESRSQSPAD